MTSNCQHAKTRGLLHHDIGHVLPYSRENNLQLPRDTQHVHQIWNYNSFIISLYNIYISLLFGSSCDLSDHELSGIREMSPSQLELAHFQCSARPHASFEREESRDAKAYAVRSRPLRGFSLTPGMESMVMQAIQCSSVVAMVAIRDVMIQCFSACQGIEWLRLL